MAYLIPDNIRSQPSIPTGHKTVAAALMAGMNEDATVWYEPPFDVDNERPHFVLVDPAVGLIIIQVLSGEVLGAVRGTLRVNEDGETEADDPIARANRFAEGLYQRMADEPLLKRLVVGGVAALPDVTRTEALERGIDTVVPLEQCLFSDDLTTGKFEDNFFYRFFLKVNHGGVGEELSHDELRALSAVLHPDTVIAKGAAQESLFNVENTEPAIKVMDRAQHQLARKLGPGHRLVRGVAGSGKTLILLKRARDLARAYPGERILVTCYNRSLAGTFAAELAEYPNVEVCHNHRLMDRAIKDAALTSPVKGNTGHELVGGVALQAAALRRPKPYRAVLVDEAQDFNTEELEFLTKLFTSDEPDEQDLLIVADNAQRIYSRKSTWKDAGIKVVGRSQILSTNYRNTTEILEFAQAFLADDPLVEVGENDEDESSIVAADGTQRSGSPVRVSLVGGTNEQVEAIVAQTKHWLADAGERPKPGSIAVLMLSQSNNDLGDRLAQRFSEDSIDAFWLTNRHDSSTKDQFASLAAPVVLSTVHSAKGLEFPKVVVTGIGTGSAYDAERRVQNRKALYVGFTRATDELVVIATSDNQFAASLGKASNELR